MTLDRFGIYRLNYRLHNYIFKIAYVLSSIKSFLLSDIVIITIFLVYTHCYNNFICELLLIFTLNLLGLLRYPSNVNLSSWDIRSLISWRRWSQLSFLNCSLNETGGRRLIFLKFFFFLNFLFLLFLSFLQSTSTSLFF